MSLLMRSPARSGCVRLWGFYEAWSHLSRHDHGQAQHARRRLHLRFQDCLVLRQNAL